MKKLSVLIIVVLVILLASYSVSFAESYFSNNSALNSAFATLEKVFLQYTRDEVIPLKNMGAIVTDPNEPRITRTTKKITDAQVKDTAEKALNDIRVAIEIKEEELGGLTLEDYKIISDYLMEHIYFAQDSEYGWDFDGKFVQLYITTSNLEDWTDFEGLTGNFGKMGKGKDQVNPADLRIKDKISRYMNQSIQKGNKISSELVQKLPGEVEKLFIESNLSRIEAGRVLASIHRDIYSPQIGDSFVDQYDGSDSIESILESYEATIHMTRYYRDEEKEIEYCQYSKDTPSNKNRAYISKQIVNENLPETFTYGFNNAVTLDELARLYFEQEDSNFEHLLDKVIIENPAIDANAPSYIKKAFIYGMIDNQKDLQKPLTRLEAARKLVKGSIYSLTGFWNILSITDCNAIPATDQNIVATCLHGGMKTRIDKFEPLSSYTKEEAIIDNILFKFENIRGYNIPISLRDPSKVIVGENTINILFENKDKLEEYLEDYFDDTVLGDIKTNKSYTRIDTGGALIELFTPENGIKFTMKNGVTYFDLDKGVYGPGVSYKIEPKVVAGDEKVDMNMQIDSVHKKLYAKLDAILAKIIKLGMTEEQKVKAIHDYVVLHITYDSKLQDEQTVQSVIDTIDNGRGVCGDYSLLFMHLCRRASIPCVFEVGDPYSLNHAWNAVFLNGQWLFVDTTWDDNDSGKVLYTHFLKDRFTFMKDHTPLMGVPDIDYYTDIDPMNIKTQDELRAYLLKNFYWWDGYRLTFRMADKNMKPLINYTKNSDVNAILTYDAKNDLYTLTGKGKK